MAAVCRFPAEVPRPRLHTACFPVGWVSPYCNGWADIGEMAAPAAGLVAEGCRQGGRFAGRGQLAKATGLCPPDRDRGA